MRKERGVTLIMVAAVLAILAAMATGFYTLMLMQTKSAVRYADTVRADMLAKAGIYYAILQLRHEAFTRTEDPARAWYQVDYLRGAVRRISFPDSELLHNGADDDTDGEADNLEEASLQPDKMRGYSLAMGSSAGPSSDRFTLNITDAAGKININAGDNLAVMLDNLCRVIGPPLVAADLDAIQPRRWADEAVGDPVAALYSSALNQDDKSLNRDLYYALTDEGGTVLTNGLGRPKRGVDGVALYGDGYAIAGFRGRHGAYQSLEDVKNALTYVERSSPPNATADDPLERLEIEVKFAAIRDHITISSWVDTNTVCVGKFEWVSFDSAGNKTYAIDRDKSWVIDDPVGDPLNRRGSLRGCYLSIINGHGAGQLRRIRTNGIDWVEVEGGFAVTPGPISSYMIVSNEEAMLVDVTGKDVTQSYPDNPPKAGTLTFPRTKLNGTLVPNPKMDYSLHPLCIHRAPVNVNTATDKVLVALLLGIEVQHGHPLAVGTDTDVELLRTKWKTTDIHQVEPYLLTPAGLKRLPATSGKVVLNRMWDANLAKKQVVPPPACYDVAYLNNCDSLGAPNYAYQTVSGQPITGTMTEAHELAYWIIMARQSDRLQPTLKFIDPKTGAPTATDTGMVRGPFRTWDELYFRAIKPWDDVRFNNGWVDKNANGIADAGDEYHKARLASMLMANLNSNTDILKFNPNIEWIDRWSRNFTALEPVMVYTNETAPPLPVAGWDGGWGPNPTVAPLYWQDVAAADSLTYSSNPIYTCVPDPLAWAGGYGGHAPPPTSSQRTIIPGDPTPRYTSGAYITRSFRYKSDELIDKTDLNRSTTEFSFDSNGIFEINSTGQVVRGAELLAERKFSALVKIYDVWRESTQAQFVQGTISKAYGDRGTSYSGQLARDASGKVERKGLVTLPEPLLPLQARIVDDKGTMASAKTVPNQEVVSAVGTGNSAPLDAFGRSRQNPFDKGANAIDVPEVLANRILPARYDGQIALATNTSAFDPSLSGDEDTFLASFDGDLDTATCLGNGREQAKWPYWAEPDGSGGFKYIDSTQDPKKGGSKVRCVQGIGLLGLLNDSLIASDPGIPLVDGKTPFNNYAADKDNIRWIYPFFGVSSALMPVKLGAVPERPCYWNNVTLRMGSLRTDGAYLSAPGVAGNNATLKYLFTPDKVDRHKKLNFQPDSKDGNCVTMWAKTAWHHDDMRNHEFFNPGNEVKVATCEGFVLQKVGQYKWCYNNESTGQGQCCNRRELNDWLCVMMFQPDSGYGGSIHGGYAGVDAKNSPNESPGYRVQPFRWSFVGLRAHYATESTPVGNMGPRGRWARAGSGSDWQDVENYGILRYYVRPFIDTALYPETQASNWADSNAKGYRMTWCYRGCSNWGSQMQLNYGGWSWVSGASPWLPYSAVGDSRDVAYPGAQSHPTSAADPNMNGGLDGRIGEGQDAKWVWAEPYGKIAEDPDKPGYSAKSFGLNNLNFGNPQYNQNLNSGAGAGSTEVRWHYRAMPEDGTYAVIDELKISNKDRVLVDSGNSDWAKDRVIREMQISRYYLPPRLGRQVKPEQGGPPTFTSQTLLQSLKGFDKTATGQNVAVVRVSWNVFTPRFMCEYKTPDMAAFKRNENLSHYAGPADQQAKVPVPFKGPFDYVKYNDDTYNVDSTGSPPNRYYSVDRPPPWVYTKPARGRLACPAQAGRGVEIELLKEDGSAAVPLGGKTFTDPAALNSLGTADAPVWVYSHKLRYRVRFCYPVDPLVDPGGGKPDVDNHPGVYLDQQYLLDTPIFDDISVTYILPPRILEFREVME
ncbi:MAG: hypothetical protein NTW87_05580 [Planctomycetota bacterium]|nr:hypothetical protein [Planctomycetota bacterium]